MGRLAALPVSRELPSGDVVVTFRLVVSRESGPAARRPDPPRWTRSTVPRGPRGPSVRPGVGAGRRRGHPRVAAQAVLASPHGASSRSEVEVASAAGGPEAPIAVRTGSVIPSNRRRTSPVRGFGPNDVDLRGIRSPRAATASTSADVDRPEQHGGPVAAGRGPHGAGSVVDVADPRRCSGRPTTAARAARRPARSRPGTARAPTAPARQGGREHA